MNLDAFWLLFIQDHLRNGLLTPLMVVVTMLGNKGIIWMVLIALLLWRRRTRWVGALAAVSFLVNAGLAELFIRPHRLVVLGGVYRLALVAAQMAPPCHGAGLSHGLLAPLRRCALSVRRRCRAAAGLGRQFLRLAPRPARRAPCLQQLQQVTACAL